MSFMLKSAEVRMKVYEGVRKCTKVYESVKRCTKVYESVQRCTEVYESVQRCTNMYESVRRCTKVYRGVRKCTKALYLFSSAYIFFIMFFLVGRTWRYCNTRATRDRGEASLFHSVMFQKSV